MEESICQNEQTNSVVVAQGKSEKLLPPPSRVTIAYTKQKLEQCKPHFNLQNKIRYETLNIRKLE